MYPAPSHGRGWVRAEDEVGEVEEQPLHVAAGNIGVGANMAFRTNTIRNLGGFDERLGAGLPTFGGEEILLFAELLLSKGIITYEPSVLVFHRHRRTNVELERQLFGRGASIPVLIFCLTRRHLWLVPSIVMSKTRLMASRLSRHKKSGRPPIPAESLLYKRQERRGYRHGIWVGLKLMLSKPRAG